jgi:ribonuclease J
MGLVPPLKGIYREDVESPDIWQRIEGYPLFCNLEKVDGLLLTHAHLDHSGHISFLKNSIPVHSTAITTFITKAIQDSGKSDFNQQVCYYNPVSVDCPNGWKQTAFLSEGGAKQQRQFYIADRNPKEFSPDTLQFWSSGFWEKSAKQVVWL